MNTDIAIIKTFASDSGIEKLKKIIAITHDADKPYQIYCKYLNKYQNDEYKKAFDEMTERFKKEFPNFTKKITQ